MDGLLKLKTREQIYALRQMPVPEKVAVPQ
jgi:hypothetical protein